MAKDSKVETLAITGGFLAVIIWLIGAAGYITHIMWCIKALVSTAVVGDILIKAIILGVVGAIVPPLGAIHGLVIWFSGWTFLL
jgi:hypothetical protein